MKKKQKKKQSSKIAKSKNFFPYCDCPKWPKIKISCWKCVSKYICVLICGLVRPQ